MGALLAGVFCGVLCRVSSGDLIWIFSHGRRAYGAVMSSFLFRIGSDILIVCMELYELSIGNVA